MTKNLNSFVLSDNTIELMKDNLKKTKELRREIGFNLCKVADNNILRDEGHCMGSVCEIRLADKCKVGEKVGLFHTHPGNGTGISKLSLADIGGGYYHGINCVGGVEDQKIKCYVRKAEKIKPKDYHIISYNIKRFKPLQKKEHNITTKRGYEHIKSIIRDRDYTINKLIDNYFNVIDIM